MVRKGGNKMPRVTELSDMEFDLQVHKDETAAKLGAMQESITEVKATVANMKEEILAEMRALLMGDRRATEQTSPQQRQLNFGSVPLTEGTPVLQSKASLASPSSVLGTCASATSVNEAVGEEEEEKDYHKELVSLGLLKWPKGRAVAKAPRFLEKAPKIVNVKVSPRPIQQPR